MTKQAEAMKMALEALDNLMYWDNGKPEYDEARQAITALREALAEQPAQPLIPFRHGCKWCGKTDGCEHQEQPAQQEQGDSICQEDDGCPTEKAVLQRFWRGQSIPDEHYPAWFKPVQQEPVAKKKHEPKIDLGKYAGTYGGYITPEPSEGYLQKAYRLANELRSHLSIAPAQRTWVGLTGHEQKALMAMSAREAVFATEAKLKEKNT